MRGSRRNRVIGALGALGVLAVGGLAVAVPPAGAATFVVTTTTDGGAGSLRDAIAQANANPGADTIEVPAGTYVLSLGEFQITDEVTIVGVAGAATTIIDADGNSRIFNASSSKVMTLDGLTLQGGNVGVSGGGAIRWPGSSLTILNSVVRDNHARFGGALYTPNTVLTIRNSEFVENVAGDPQTSGTSGGALHIEGTSTLDISGSTFEGNRSDNGNGGAIVSTGTTGTITNSTFTENEAMSNGGAMRLDNGTNLSLRYVTVEGNTLANGSLGAGILSIGTATTTLTNTLLLGNSGGGGTDSNCGTNAGGVFVSGDGNLSDDATCGVLTQPADLNDNTGTSVGALADNGGPTRTMALNPASTAIDAAPCIGAVTTVDQRGITRPQGTGCDIGAYELEQDEPTTTTESSLPGSSSTSSTSTPVTTPPATAVAATPMFTG